MLIRVCTFTDAGKKLAERLFEGWEDMRAEFRAPGEALSDWTAESFSRRLPILFVGACGIAVRAIAPFVSDKLSDSPVLVMDERGGYAIPILSGHVGGANALAQKLAGRLGAQAVITTATDVEGCFSVDVFAAEHGLHILNREGIRRVSAKLLAEKTVTVYAGFGCEGLCGLLPPEIVRVHEEDACADIRIVRPCACAPRKEGALDGGSAALTLVVKELIIGVGCKKGKDFFALRSFVENALNEIARAPGTDFPLCAGMCALDSIRAFATIDRKRYEPGIMNLAQYYRVPLLTYRAEELAGVPGTFTESDFVRHVTGVSNVCERAALLAAGDGGVLIQKKRAFAGMTVAAARIGTSAGA